MKTFVNLILVVVLASITGCAGNRDLIAKTSIASRQDVFQEAQTVQSVPGRAMLKVEFSIKNFKARFINTYYKHTDPPYTAILNIDGQTVVLSDAPVLEDLPGDFKNNPEVGIGWRYDFNKTLQLQSGKHHVSIAVPLSDVIIEKDIDLKEGSNLLNILPIYNAPVIRYPKFPRFSKDIRGLSVKLNYQDI